MKKLTSIGTGLILLLALIVVFAGLAVAARGDIATWTKSNVDVVRVDRDGNLVTLSGFALRRHATAASMYATSTDSVIAVTSTAAARYIYLPDVSSTYPGQLFVVKDESGAAATHNITVWPYGTEQIDGASLQTISSNNGVLRVYSSGAAWFTF